MKISSHYFISLAIPAFLSLSLVVSIHAKSVEQQIEKPIQDAIKTQQKTQKEVENWQADRLKLTTKLDTLTRETKELGEYKDRLKINVDAASKRIILKQRQLDETSKITEEITPFLEELLTQLEEVSNDGPPFLQQERQQRLEKMQVMMSDPKISIGEKYRRIMEALQIEAEYGFTTEVYQQEVRTEEGVQLVDIFRLGRLNLFYITLDGRNCGFYNEATSNWEKLEQDWLREITLAIAMARKEKPVNFVELPLGRINATEAVQN